MSHFETVEGKEIAKDRIRLYDYLVDLYTQWYRLHPTGFVRSTEHDGDKSTNPGRNDRGRSRGRNNRRRGGGHGGRGGRSGRQGIRSQPDNDGGQEGTTEPKSDNTSGDESSASAGPAPRNGTCWHCGGKHYLSRCPTATLADKRAARTAHGDCGTKRSLNMGDE